MLKLTISCFISFFLFCFFTSSSPEEEELLFDIYLKEKLIGTLRATHKTAGSEQIYFSKTIVNKKIIIKKVKVDYEYLVSFKDNYLSESNVNVFINEKPYAKTSTKWSGDQYEVLKNEKRKSILKDKFMYSTILLFFKEPKAIKECYSEMDGSINKIVSLGNHKYKKINAKGKENLYLYKEGKLTQAFINGIINFEIRAQN